MNGLEKMRQCPRFSKCNAPICPLDQEWHKSSMLAEDAVCFFMNEAAKAGAQGRFALRGHAELFRLVSDATPSIIAANSTIRNRLERAAQSGSRMDRKPPWDNGGSAP